MHGSPAIGNAPGMRPPLRGMPEPPIARQGLRRRYSIPFRVYTMLSGLGLTHFSHFDIADLLR